MKYLEKIDLIWTFLHDQHDVADRNLVTPYQDLHETIIDIGIDTGEHKKEVRALRKIANWASRRGFQGVYWAYYLRVVRRLMDELTTLTAQFVPTNKHDSASAEANEIAAEEIYRNFLALVRRDLREILVDLANRQSESYQGLTHITEQQARQGFYICLLNHHELGFALF